MRRYTVQTAAALFTAVVLITVAVQPAAAVHELIDCETEGVEPLMLLFHDVANVIYAVAGVGGIVVLAYAGLVFMFGGQDRWRQAKRRVKGVIVGIIFVFSASLVVVFIANRLPGCGGA